jgi:Fe2+ transport system protein FeoA
LSELVSRRALASLRIGETGILDQFDLPAEMAERFMQMGMIPGVEILAAHLAPAGDPTVYRCDGTEIALRRETAQRISIVGATVGE